MPRFAVKDICLVHVYIEKKCKSSAVMQKRNTQGSWIKKKHKV